MRLNIVSGMRSVGDNISRLDFVPYSYRNLGGNMNVDVFEVGYRVLVFVFIVCDDDDNIGSIFIVTRKGYCPLTSRTNIGPFGESCLADTIESGMSDTSNSFVSLKVLWVGFVFTKTLGDIKRKKGSVKF